VSEFAFEAKLCYEVHDVSQLICKCFIICADCWPVDTPAAWDEDDPTPPKKSSWDLPTPKSVSGRDRSERSDRSVRSDRGYSSRDSERRRDRGRG